MTHTNNDTANREVVITRLLNAPQALVYEAWTNPKHVINWWGPDGFTNTFHEMEVKPGGVWDFMMHGPDGTDYPNRIIFKEVLAPHRLAYVHGSGEENDPNEFEVVVTFEPQGDKTLLTLRSIFATQQARDFVIREHGAIEGGNQTINHLEEYLKTTKLDAVAGNELIITREFNAPRELVFQAWTDPQHLSNWWGPKEMKITSLTLDLRPGGMLLYCMSAGGMEMWGKFIYHEAAAPERIVFVSSFADKDGNTIRAPFSNKWPLEVYNVLTLTEHDGKTLLTLHGGPVNATADEMKMFEEMHNSMQQGFGGTFDQLDEFLATQQA